MVLGLRSYSYNVQYLFQIRFAEMSAIEAKADSSTDENETSRS